MRRTRRRSIAVIWLLQLLLLAGWGSAAWHQHVDGHAGHSCAVCSAAQTSAVPSVSTSAPAPRLVACRGVIASVADDPLDSFRGALHSRAPPIA